jgi:hypothetical protein
MWWPRLENKINEIIQNYKEETYSEERTEREMLEEVLDLTRMMTKRMPRRRENVRHVLGALIDLTDRLLVRMVDEKEDVFLFMDELCHILEVLCVELDCHMYLERVIDMRSRVVHMVR